MRQISANEILSINDKFDDDDKLTRVESEERLSNTNQFDDEDNNLRRVEVETKPTMTTNRFKAVVAINLNAIFMFMFVCSIKVASN